MPVSALEDYEVGIRLSGGARTELALPKSDVLKFILADGSWAAARPSGTEPKCKFYFCAQGRSKGEAESKLAAMAGYFKRF